MNYNESRTHLYSYLVGKETNHLPTQHKTLHHTMKLQTNVVNRIHVLRGFNERSVRMFWDVLGTNNIA